ncbi:uncharacterized protein BCR38DRAFT_484812 [Pseudomassariella vexata]|uniref:Ras-GAP domain-containing protein n=1 Tax=Pseudomassariella vexata TaxID=1141098 RepID=A0A1Y2E205_9PEZI|nr:uncharacterized protein BCR38DRAFT_484812 [Pseudomassariella vexata]ORY65384.1 hypothetical protein BCR38DRAFT_484812 [Pseudomassariella vexata]
MNGILPPGMDGGTRSGGHVGRLPQGTAITLPRGGSERERGGDRSNFRTSASRSTIRTVTPEPAEHGHATTDTNITQAPLDRAYGTTSPQTSPRPIPGGERRRQGVIFKEAYGGSFDSSESSPPQHQSTAVRARTQTMDTALALRQQQTAASSTTSRHRVGSLSSSGSIPFTDVDGSRVPPVTNVESVGYPSITPAPPPDLKITVSSSRDKKGQSSSLSNRRLIKRASSRPTSPLISPPPSVDSLPIPIPTDDSNKVLLLMKTLCGRMRGEVEYQSEQGGPWYRGICYIDEERGSLLFDSGQSAPFHMPIVADLRGCRVLPVDFPESGTKCLELANSKAGIELLLRPLLAAEFDLWLAALLCWQQLKPGGIRLPSGRGNNSPVAGRPDLRRRGSSATGSTSSKDAAIIKVGKVMLWDKGVANSPRAIVKRPSTRDLRGSATAWRRVSCILQDNGEFKLMTENDVTVLSVIELSQLSRCAVQQLDKSVLDETYCIAIFPIYSSTSRQLSIFRPVYIALDSRVLFEVWFVLLRAFAVPDLYGIGAGSDQVSEITNFETEFDGQMFRLEKTIEVRLTEAKIRTVNPAPEQHERYGRGDRDAGSGNYFAEVILDGEVRARTTTQPTNNPFWREAAQFTELATALPYLSIVLKRVDGNLEGFSQQLQASLGLPKTGNLTEVMCGSVDIQLDKLERGKDHEQWQQILDEKNESIGSMLVKINHQELVVLMTKDYEVLSDLLHKFSIGLTNQIASAMPQQLRRLAELFLNIFQVTNKSSEWLMALVEEEIDGLSGPNSMKKMRFSRRLKSNDSNASASERELLVRDMGKSLAGEANLLFRGNSLLTQALECHMRRLGKDYLEEILSDKIFEINEINPDCEVDPIKVRGEDINQHWTQLMQLTNEVFECIASSATKLPAELRQILKYVRAVAEDRYGDFLRTVTYTSVSGFLFLRFICPAILNPKLFGLLRDNPRPKAQRTLTLIAKGLQALGNLATFGKKESFMEPMNKFLNHQRQPFKDFIDQVCSISAERNGVTLPATYTTPITILGRLSPISREGFPALPYLIDHPRNYAALVKLWLEAHHANDPSSHILEGELAQFHDACVRLQKRSDDCMARIESIRAAETMSILTDDVTESLEKTSLVDHAHLAYVNQPAWMENDPYRAPGSSGSEQEGGDRSIFRDLNFRSNRDGSSLRQVSDSSEISHTGGTLRRNGINPRQFLSGLIGGKKHKSEGHTSTPSSMREKNRDKEGGSRSMLGGFSESWQSDNSRH